MTSEGSSPVDAAKFPKPNPTMSVLYQTMKQRGIVLDATLLTNLSRFMIAPGC